MAKIIDLPRFRFNSDSIEYTSPRSYIDGSSDIINLNGSSIISNNTLQFENKNGENVLITPLELKEHISEFITNEINLYADASVNEYQKKLVRRLNIQMINIEFHINNKLNKMTEDIISATTSRIINEEVNRRVDEKLQKIKK